MSLTMLVRRQRKLFLPVGLPGTGKTTLGRQAAGLLGLSHVERDRLFESDRDRGTGLKQAKQHTHQTLLVHLSRDPHVYLDSTNGYSFSQPRSAAARQLYVGLHGGDTLELHFPVAPADLPLLQQRLTHRVQQGGTGFPAEPTEQLAKLNRIGEGMELDLAGHARLTVPWSGGNTEEILLEMLAFYISARAFYSIRSKGAWP